MKIGLVTDIHNDAVQLREALRVLSQHRVDAIITIGDTFDPIAETDGMEEVAELLLKYQAIGVWGNHDLVFSHETPTQFYDRYPPVVFECVQSIKPSIIHRNASWGDVHISHRECYVDPFDQIEMWGLTGEDIDHWERAERAVRHGGYRLQLVGHYHAWMAFNRTGRMDWNGDKPLDFDRAEKYYVVIAAIIDGWCAILDDDARVLLPIKL